MEKNTFISQFSLLSSLERENNAGAQSVCHSLLFLMQKKFQKCLSFQL